MKRRVVVTGLGIISPIGNDIDTFWENVKKGTVGIGEITKFDTTDFKVKLAAEVKDLMLQNIWISAKQEEWNCFLSMQ